jgi:hypothetical protein
MRVRFAASCEWTMDAGSGQSRGHTVVLCRRLHEPAWRRFLEHSRPAESSIPAAGT